MECNFNKCNCFFYENGTGKLTGNDVPREYDFTWKYDNELSCYVIAASQTMNTKIQVDDTGEYIILLGRCKFYRQDNSK